MSQNPNDQIRQQMLQYFYNRNTDATSRFGKKGSAVKISDVKSELKERHGLKQNEVVSNLTYLIDRGWINTVEIEKTVRVAGGTVPSTVTWYEISSAGIDRIEGGSEFERRERYAGINITATGSNIITLGDGNLVNAQFAALHRALDALKNDLSASPSLDESAKLDVAVDIESIKDQLAKEHPNKTIIGHLWSVVEKVATGAGFVAAVTKVKALMAPLL